MEGTSQRHWRKCEYPGRRNGETIAAYGWGVYGIGEHSVEYWENKHNSDVQVIPAGTWTGLLSMQD
jgi:hypothetical protein